MNYFYFYIVHLKIVYSCIKIFFAIQVLLLSVLVLQFCFFKISFGPDRCRQINNLNFSLPYSPLDLLCILFWKKPWASTLVAHGLFIADGS